MKRMMIALAAAGFLAGAMPATADEALFKSKGCVKCHDAEKKKKGPAVTAMTAKFKGDVGKATAAVKSKDHPEVDATDAELAKLVKHAIGAK